MILLLGHWLDYFQLVLTTRSNPYTCQFFQLPTHQPIVYFLPNISHPTDRSNFIEMIIMCFFYRCLQVCRCHSIMAAFKGIWTKPFWRAVSGEFLATLIFVLISLGSTINWASDKEKPPPADLVLISLCFGLSIATMVQCFAHISGGHINPAVTAAMLVTRKMSLAKALFYVLAQCLGAITGAGILFLVTPSAVQGSLGVTTVRCASCSHFFIVV